MPTHKFPASILTHELGHDLGFLHVYNDAAMGDKLGNVEDCLTDNPHNGSHKIPPTTTRYQSTLDCNNMTLEFRLIERVLASTFRLDDTGRVLRLQWRNPVGTATR